MHNTERLLTTEEVADRLQLSPHTVRRWLRSGRLPGQHMANLWRVREADLDAYVRDITDVAGPVLQLGDDAISNAHWNDLLASVCVKLCKSALEELAGTMHGDHEVTGTVALGTVDGAISVADTAVKLLKSREHPWTDDEAELARNVHELIDVIKGFNEAFGEWYERTAGWVRPPLHAIGDPKHPWHGNAVHACEQYDYTDDRRGEILWRVGLTELQAISFILTNIATAPPTQTEIGRRAGVDQATVSGHVADAHVKLAEVDGLAQCAARIKGIDPLDTLSEFELIQGLLEEPPGSLYTSVSRHGVKVLHDPSSVSGSTQ
jgi:excisionase family DNA binding protein